VSVFRLKMVKLTPPTKRPFDDPLTYIEPDNPRMQNDANFLAQWAQNQRTCQVIDFANIIYL